MGQKRINTSIFISS